VAEEWERKWESNEEGADLSISQRVLDTLLPPRCLLCAGDAGLRSVCAACIADLPRLPIERCPVCALPSPGNHLCGECLKRPRHFDATHAVYRYAFPTDKLVQALKYSRRLASADFLAHALFSLPMTSLPDLILPVPLSAKRLAERGFNQSVELARPLARHLGLSLELTAVRRHKHTTPQASLPWKARASNIRHAFECNIDLSGKTIWVIDDVMTTGATLDELARVLKLHGAARVENRVVTRAVKG
jgi:ComF family protein